MNKVQVVVIETRMLLSEERKQHPIRDSNDRSTRQAEKNMSYQIGRCTRNLMIVGLLTASGLSSAAAPQGTRTPAVKASTQSTSVGTPYHYQPNPVPRREALYYSTIWGIESLNVKLVESGEVVRFTYRVLDGDKAKMLNDKKNEPSLIDPERGVKLVVPSLEKVGALRQSAAPEPGKSYWMAFSNSGRPVKRGDRVDIEIGQFKARGLTVD